MHANAPNTTSIETSGKRQQRDRRVQRHDAVARLVACGAARRTTSKHAPDRPGRSTTVNSTTAPRGTTNVRTAASSTTHDRDDPDDDEQDVGDDVHGDYSSPDGRRRLRLMSPCWRFSSTRRFFAARDGLVEYARRVDVQRGREPRLQPFERELAVLVLRPPLRRGHAHDRTEPLEQPRPLARPERRRRRDVEAHLDLGVRRVRVLAARAARRREPPLELVAARSRTTA